MKREHIIRLIAGTVVLTSAALVHFVSEWWLLLTCFAGLNLVQSAFTGFCPPEIFLKKMGWGTSTDDEPCCRQAAKDGAPSAKSEGACCGSDKPESDDSPSCGCGRR